MNINYLAVLVAAAANMVVGALWYGPVFGKTWMKLQGLTKDAIKSMPLTPAQAMSLGVVTALLVAVMLSQLLNVSGLTGSMLAFWLWLGFAVPASAEGWLWEGKPFALFLLNAARWLVTLLAMSWILAAWH